MLGISPLQRRAPVDLQIHDEKKRGAEATRKSFLHATSFTQIGQVQNTQIIKNDPHAHPTGHGMIAVAAIEIPS
jgi:hypothetical protein